MFKTIKTSSNGNVIITERPLGYAVSVRKQVWNKLGRVYEYVWTPEASKLSRDDAETLFAALAA